MEELSPTYSFEFSSYLIPFMEAGYWEYGASCIKIKEGTIASDTSDRFDEQNTSKSSKQPRSYSVVCIYLEASPFQPFASLHFPAPTSLSDKWDHQHVRDLMRNTLVHSFFSVTTYGSSLAPLLVVLVFIPP
ncbi:hypothetical protein PTI98_004176 [Pleurotus ostreatus]|nr:hypothetical protein PTI98_004176 [Pleurotus ostreatus]